MFGSNRNRPCQANIPALCHFHGVPHPVLSVKAANKELKLIDEKIKSANINIPNMFSGLMEFNAEYEDMKLRRDYLSGSLDDFSRKYAQEKFGSEANDYRDKVLKTILKENSVEWNAYKFNNNIFLKQKPFGTKTFDGGGWPDGATYQEGNDFVRRTHTFKEASIYAAKHGFDGVSIVTEPNTKLGIFFVPYKLKAGQFSDEQREQILGSSVFKNAFGVVQKQMGDLYSGKIKLKNK
jgi:hypothetical protein